MKTVTLLLLCALTFPAQGHRYIRYDKALAADCRHIAKEVAAIEKNKSPRPTASSKGNWLNSWPNGNMPGTRKNAPDMGQPACPGAKA